MDLTLIWAALIAFVVVVYVLLDGFDLGVGILFPYARKSEHRTLMIDSLAPFWDGNETWLILGGAGLLAAFPVAYAIVLSAFYLPLMLMLFALIFRGVAFEFRAISRPELRFIWDISFNLGSTVAAFAQGMVLGGLVGGIAIEGRDYAGGPFDWLSWFSVMTGLAVVYGYALLGATWLILKTEGELQEWARGRARFLLAAVVVFMGIVSLWTPLAHPDVAERWFAWPNTLYVMPVPAVTVVVIFTLWQSIGGKRELAPYLLAAALFLLGFLGLAISLWPYVVPGALTIWEAASPFDSQLFVLVGVAVLIPVILAYTANNYWVFRGKVSGGYEH